MTSAKQENIPTPPAETAAGGGSEGGAGLSLGERLRRARSAKGVSLAQAAEAIRIHATTLAALEENNREGLPAQVYTRGFIRIYASYLGLDPDEALRLHIEEQGLPAAATTEKINIQQIMAAESMAEAPRRITGNHVFILLLLLVLAFVGYWAYTSQSRIGETDDTMAEKGIFDPLADEMTTPEAAAPTELPELPQALLAPASAPADSASNGEPEPTVGSVPEPPATGESNDGAEEPVATPPAGSEETAPDAEAATEALHLLEAYFTEDTWLRVKIDDEPARQLFFEAGASRQWRADERIEMRIGNAGGVDLVFDGTPLPALGPSGQVVNLDLP